MVKSEKSDGGREVGLNYVSKAARKDTFLQKFDRKLGKTYLVTQTSQLNSNLSELRKQKSGNKSNKIRL